MGRKTRKTRWRTLAIADESDSEESNTLSGSQVSKSYNHRQFYSKFTYSSQSTPTRRFPYEPKSTRSSSTASENKITFNEDEYTKITTPRQDVLFKKGYLSKPKNYQTQTSTGNSTASTGNSTGNGTPDHQSADGTEGTDLEYESQFVFPNAFVDQNGIYYLNGYEHYPLVMYNPPICYPEYPLSRTKRHSTGSLTESASPHTEEASQDLNQSGGENTGNGPEFNQVYNVVYPGYYFNGVCSPNATTNGQAATEPRKIKKKRRRKISKSLNQEETTSSEDGYSSDEAITQVENRVQNPKELRTNGQQQSDETAENAEVVAKEPEKENPDKIREEKDADEDSGTIDPVGDSLNENDVKDTDCSVSSKEDESGTSTQNCVVVVGVTEVRENLPEIRENLTKESRFNLNAEEFVPRAYRPLDQPMPLDPNLQFINIHPNFVPLPLINHPLNELNPPPFNPSFLPPGIPINFVPADPKLLPNFVNFVPNHFAPSRKNYEQPQNAQGKVEEVRNKEEKVEPSKEEEIVEEVEEEVKEPERIDGEKLKNLMAKNDVDIAKIVSKLEEAAKEQKLYENRRQSYRNSPNKLNKGFRPRFNSPYQNEQGRQPYDKRRPRRFENIDSKSTSTGEEEGTRTIQAKPEGTQTDQQTKTEPKEAPKEEEEQKFSPRHHAYKNPNSPRKYVNYNSRNFKGRTPEFQHSHSLSIAEFSDTSKKANNYSKSCPRFEKYSSTRSGGTVESAREIPKSPLPNGTSQWISVSNKKKRKNKSTNDDEAEVLEDQVGQAQIEIPPPSPMETRLGEESSKIDDIIEMIAKSEATTSKTIDIPDSQIQHVTDIEKALLEESEKIQDITAKDATSPKPNESLQAQTKVTKEGAKKKAKKGNVKAPAIKRIIILDPDTSSKDKNEMNTSNKIVEIPDEVVDAKPEISEDAPPKEPPVLPAPVQETEAVPKKSKKKKKPAKSNLSTSSSTTNLAQIDDSYDFLLDTAVLVDDKTNIEVSEELDKMIQKGLFGNLEEKFRSLNVSVDDDFFKSLSLKPKTQSTPEKGFIKATNFTTILNNANNNQALTKVKAGDDSHKMAKLQEDEPQPSTSKTGNFLEKTVQSETAPVVEVGQRITNTKGNGRLRNKSKKNVASDGGKIGDGGNGSKKGEVDGESGGRHVKINFEDAEGDKNENPKLDEGILAETTAINEQLTPDESVEENGAKIYTRDEIAKLVNGYPLQNDSGQLKGTDTVPDVKIDVALATNDGTPATIPTDDDGNDAKLDSNFLKNADFSPSPPSKEERIVIKIEESAKLDGEKTRNAIELKPLYPITQAVKDWMTKTRETTPDIEILKSPDTIYKEFIEDDAEDDSDTETNQKNALSNPSPVDYFDQQEICHYSMGARVATPRTDVEDDLTICETWSMSQDTSLQDDADLLDCWEPEIGEAAAKKEEIPIEQAEDVLQLVEDDFGKDEFLRLKAEVEEQKKNGTFPKHGHLPYRAICCSLM